MKRIIAIVGTRPEAIKMAPVLLALRGCRSRVKTSLVLTSQHKEMLRQALDVFRLAPDFDIGIMAHNQSLSQITSRVLGGLEEYFHDQQPDLVLVQGDTTTAFAASLAAFYLRIPVGHVEAGLRTGRISDPFPEEMNRKLIDHLSVLLFAPTKHAEQNLLREGMQRSRVFVTGNTVIDAVAFVKAAIETGRVAVQQHILDVLSDGGSDVILITTHRRESFGKPLRDICLGLQHVADEFPKKTIVFPVHMNPNVRNPVKTLLQGLKNVRLIETVDYASFVYLMSKACLILTDSGGIQEEVTYLNKPTLVLRECTERTEAEDTGLVRLIGRDSDAILRSVVTFFDSDVNSRPKCTAASPFGDGRAAARIVRILLQYIGAL